ncbi:hypothetical protein [Streptomyces profundus]|uniref:hypothetical protein n=1 Tax=Streptomyces profundus TaxID=2867410 RepID=UPI001D160170|nr:hypothetical protein [Streptomyces sp. MA3_2.13]UED87458.1 hypothetical protein K4G22_27405 [Streptomyces sp. MA3_2.13]
MDAEELIGLLARQRDHLRENLTPQAQGDLLDAVGALRRAGGDERERRRALNRVRRVLLTLPLDSQVREEVDNGVRLDPGSSVVDAARVDELLRLLTPPGEQDGTDDAATWEILRAAHRRLLAAPSRPAPGAQEGLIRLPDPERGVRCPEFQFGPDDRPRSVVRRVNALLLADEDPWGAADWWLGGNRWLEGVPAQLVGEIPDTLLIEAARALVEGD